MNRYLLSFIFVASILDAILTDVGLRLQFIEEGNPIMRYLYDNSYLSFYGFKVLLPLSLFFLSAKIGKLLVINRLVQLSAVVYAGILIIHYYWISVSFNFTA
ncbi:MAG: hypothetical protein K0Q81_442 [Paenibacillus sp.]|nr:hypothetical protein [Paenibacillus sp.]